jgi:DNA processing protein
MNREVLLAGLSWNAFIGPKRYDRILERTGSVEAYFELPVGEQVEMIGVKAEGAEKLFRAMAGEGEKIVEACRAKGIQMLSRDDPAYPARLLQLTDAPFLLYVLGNYNPSIKTVAVVGTREYSSEAEEVNRWFTSELVNYHIGIVSGLAKGHDHIAQSAVVALGGYTVAVLGSGVDVVYPRDYRNLYDRIVDTGCVVSEYAPGTLPDRLHFPLRNRIISGLSDAVLVVQAPAKSGALHTAKYAEHQGRELWVVPGNPVDPRYEGSNRLIRDGAKIALRPEEIVLDVAGNGRELRKVEPAASKVDCLSPEEEAVWKLLEQDAYIDELAGKCGLQMGALNALLTKLELRGLVVQYPGRFYARAV